MAFPQGQLVTPPRQRPGARPDAAGVCTGRLSEGRP